MNAPANIIATQLCGKNEFHCARSKLLDAFAKIEVLVADTIQAQGGELNPTAPFSNKLKELKKLAPGPTLSKERAKKIDSAASELAALYALRADIVHSQLEVRNINSISTAIFRNSARSECHAPVRLFTLEEMQKVTTEVSRLASHIAQLLKNPSNPPSPHQPAQA